LQDESAMGQRRVGEQGAKAVQADLSLADPGVPVGLAAQRNVGVVAVAGADSGRRDKASELVERRLHPFGAAVVVAGGIGMGGVEDYAQTGGVLGQAVQDL